MTPLQAFVVVLGLSLQAQVAPPRDAQRPAPAASATVKGRVVMARTGEPARNTQVNLRPAGQSVEPRAGAGSTHTILTGADGTFAFTEVEPGRYMLSASKRAYLTAEYGGKQPGGPGTLFEVGAGATLPSMNLELRKGSVLTGRIVDALGEPVQYATVGVMRDVPRARASPSLPAKSAGDVVGSSAVYSAVTNDLGQFRVFGLIPGDYICAAAGEGAYRLGRGQGHISQDEHARTYYPGTVFVSQAQPVRVGLEAEIGGLDIVLQAIQKVRVRGVTTTSLGEPAEHGSISLDPDHPRRSFDRVTGRSLDANGRFEITGVPPGDYIATVAERARDGAPDPPEVAQVMIKVAGEEIDGLAITTGPGVTLSGQVRFDGEAPQVDRDSGALVAQSTDPAVSQSATRFRLADDWSFELRGLYGRRVLTWPAPPAGWALQAVRLTGRDITNEVIDFKPGAAPVRSLEVLFSRRR